jgi:hypothetical protein
LPDLQEQAEDIADEWDIDIRQVNEMMAFMVNEGLFEIDFMTNRVVCSKIEHYLDEYIRKVPEIKYAIDEFKCRQMAELSTKVDSPTMSDNVRQTPSRIEETRIEEKRVDKWTHPTLDVPMNKTRYENLCATYSPTLVDDYIQRVVDWGAATGKRTKDYAARAGTWLKRDEQDGKIRRPAPQDAKHDFSSLRSGYGK